MIQKICIAIFTAIIALVATTKTVKAPGRKHKVNKK